jgi:hypothetical protein
MLKEDKILIMVAEVLSTEENFLCILSIVPNLLKLGSIGK